MESAVGFSLILSIVATIVMVGTIIGAAKHWAGSLNQAWRTCCLLPPLFIGSTGMDAATWDARRRLRAADEYWFRAAADQVCHGKAASLALAAHGYTNSSFDCSDHEQIGPPNTERGSGGASFDACSVVLSQQPAMVIAARFAYTLIFNVALLTCVPLYPSRRPSPAQLCLGG